MKVMCLDVGAKRIGVAVSDPTGMLARSLTVIQRRNLAAAIAEIVRLAAQEDVDRVIVGLPLTLRGEVGPQAQLTLDFIDTLRNAVPVQVDTWDESYSTVKAAGALRSQGIKSRQQRDHIDAAAAAVILQEYLDTHPKTP